MVGVFLGSLFFFLLVWFFVNLFFGVGFGGGGRVGFLNTLQNIEEHKGNYYYSKLLQYINGNVPYHTFAI